MKKWGIKRRWIIIILLLLAGLLILALIPPDEHMPIRYVDRENGMIKTEKVAGEKWLVWLYNNPVGEAALWTLAKRKFVSSCYGNMMDKPSSVEKIAPFIDEYNIDLSISQKQEFSSFNDFFTRALKDGSRRVDTAPSALISPADGKILAYSSLLNNDFLIKGVRFNAASFLSDDDLGESFKDGSLIIVRLAPNDYHRFHFPVDGKIEERANITGDYYSVNPIALREMTDIFFVNKRAYTIIESSTFGKIVMAEVGATMVGSIIQTYAGKTAAKGDEKGYFKFGGSTVVLLFQKDAIAIDQDLLENTAQGLETMVFMGEKIGTAVKHSAR